MRFPTPVLSRVEMIWSWVSLLSMMLYSSIKHRICREPGRRVTPCPRRRAGLLLEGAGAQALGLPHLPGEATTRSTARAPRGPSLSPHPALLAVGRWASCLTSGAEAGKATRLPPGLSQDEGLGASAAWLGARARLLTSTMVWFPLSARSMQGPSLFSARESRNFLVL